MANAQIKFLNKRGGGRVKALLIIEILNVLNRNLGLFLSSHEILALMPPTSVAPLRLLIANYSGGFGEAASHIGSLCAELAQRGVLIHGHQRCTVLRKLEDAFAA